MDSSRHIVQVYVGALSPQYEALSVEASKKTTSEEIVTCICDRLKLPRPSNYELAEVIVGNAGGQECKERRLGRGEHPVAVQMLWPKSSMASSSSSSINNNNNNNNVKGNNVVSDDVASAATEFQAPEYRLYLRERVASASSAAGGCGNAVDGTDPQLIRDYFLRFLYQPKDKEYPDLCQLADLNESSLLDNLKARFHNGHIYTYVGSILIALNPFKFYPIYNPKYVKLYQNRRLGELPPHIFAVADAAYHTMLRDRRNQCIVISGESGSGKTESTNLLLHHLTAISQKGTYGSGVEQTILSAGPVLEAFGNAKTAHNNNSSRFGKFIQVNYKENGMVHGALVQKYLLEKSRIVSQAKKERNYHVFYYLLVGANEEERTTLRLLRPQEYHYLNQSSSYILEGVDEMYEFLRLKQSMEMVGFPTGKQQRLFAVLSAVLHLGNIEFVKKSMYHHDEAVLVKNPELVTVISSLLKVKDETLMMALTTKKARVSGETLVINYRLPEAIAARDALAKCLYGALFDWIVLQVNHALLSKKDTKEHSGHSIGVLDIFGFEDFGVQNGFEQFCINFANEHLQYYFNQHVFKYEQEEYKREGIRWKIIEFLDNTGCLGLIEGKPNGLLCILDDQCNFPGATNETLLQKYNSEHKDNEFYDYPQRRDHAFVIKHYAGKVKYNVKDFREKNLDSIRHDIVSVLKNSSMVFVRELVGSDPVAVFRWAILRAFIRATFAFQEAGRRHHTDQSDHFARRKQSSCEKRHSLGGRSYASAYRRQSGGSDSSDRSFGDAHNNHVDGKRLSGGGGGCDDGMFGNDVGCSMQKLEGILGASDARAIQRAKKIMQKSKTFRPRSRNCKGLKNLQSVKTLAGKIQGNAPSRAVRKQSPTVTAQFQNSLILLMETLNDASPFFVRCIKSNSDKVPNKFDEDIVLRQLRYTGMLETVRIRQSGYNVRFTFDEFIQIYRILLPKGLLSSQNDVRSFLLTMNLNRDNYQIGRTKVFLRESEKSKLDLRLHQAILDRIVTIQRWYRFVLERRAFLRLRAVVVGIQSYARKYLVQRWFVQMHKQYEAAMKIQAQWRGYRERTRYQRFRRGVIFLQSCLRGVVARNSFRELQNTRRIQEAEEIERQQRLKLCLEQDKIAKELQQLEEQHQRELQSLQEAIDKPTKIDRRVEIVCREQIEYREPLARARPERSRDSVPEVQYERRRSEKYEVRVERQKDDRRLEIQQHQRIERHEAEQHGSMQQSLSTPRGPSDHRAAESVVDGLSWSQSDEAFLSKESSQEELENDRLFSAENLLIPRDHRDSEESSGIQEDSEADSMPAEPAQPIQPPPQLPPRVPAVPLPPKQLPTLPPISPTSLQGSPTSPVAQAPVADIQPKTKPNNNVDKTNHSNLEEILKRPMRKLSIKRSKSARASLTGDTQPPLVPVRHNKEERLETKASVIMDMSKETDHYIKGGSSTVDEIPTNRNPFHRAKKHLKGAIEFLGKKNKNLPGGGEGSDESDESVVTAKESPEESPEQSPIESAHALDKYDVVIAPTSMMADKILLTSTFSPASGQRQHNFKTVNKFAKSEVCVTCEKSMATFFSQGYRCTDCHAAAHPRCVQQANKWECNRRSPPLSGTKSRRPTITRIDVPPPTTGNWNVTCRKEYSDRADKVVSDVMELKLMDEFISRKIFQMEETGGKRDTVADVVFKRALREFKAYLISTYSVLAKEGRLSLRYKDLIGTFESTMENVCRREKSATFPVTLGVNAFRGFLNEFVSDQHRLEEKPKTKVKKDKRKKGENVTNHLGHTFALVVVNIPTACEVCTSFMWLMEKSLVCQKCKFTCHKKCCSKITLLCKDDQDTSASHGGRMFGARLQALVSDDQKVPVIVDRLITTIEIKGLYTEGIYRKSGSSSKVRALRQDIENDVDKVNYDEYPVHVLTTTLKAFFREMPEPVLTFEAYDQFIRATDVSDAVERVSTIFTLIDKLPRINYDLVERLVFHLARVAQQEQSNFMSASSLAIVFAPCVLRTNKNVNAQDSLNDIAKQTMCIESIIVEQLKKLKTTLADIDTLDMVCHKASHRLSSLRSSKTCLAQDNAQFQTDARDDVAVEEKILTHQIESLKNEKALLTTVLPTLKRTCSDEDMLSVDMGSSVSSVDEIPHHNHEEYAVTFDLPVGSATSLNHLTKTRVNPPRRRRRPSKLAKVGPVKAVSTPSTATMTTVLTTDPTIEPVYQSTDMATFKDDAIMV